MTKRTLKLVGLLASTLAVTACSNSYTHDTLAYSGPAYGTPSYGATSYVSNYGVYQAPRVYQGHAYSSAQGPAYSTVLRPSAPYGMAVSAAPYVNAHGYAREKGGYFNMGAVSYDVDSHLYGVQARVGYNVSPYLGAEIEGSISTNKDDFHGAVVSVDHSAAMFGIAQVPFTNHLTFLTRAGYHATQYGGAGSATVDTNGFAYGVGAEYSLNRKNAFRLDYTRYQSNNATTNDAVSLVYAHKF